MIVDNIILTKRQFDPKDFENLNFALQKLHRPTLLGLFTQFHIHSQLLPGLKMTDLSAPANHVGPPGPSAMLSP